jgi:hypothetical protein
MRSLIVQEKSNLSHQPPALAMETSQSVLTATTHWISATAQSVVPQSLFLNV